MQYFCCLTITTDVVTMAGMALGANVKKFREEAGLTQTQLAELAGMDQQALAALEKRDSKSSSFTPALAKALKKPVEVLLGLPHEGPRAVPQQDEGLIDPDELSELIALYGGATTYGRMQLMRSARTVEKRQESSGSVAAND
jgi:transcriptional regulator with XRE-family HTH domain